MSDRFESLDEGHHTEGTLSAWTRAESRYGRRHHDHDTDRWARYENRQDRD